MRYGIREYEEASCKISGCDAVPEHLRKDMREITDVMCAPSGRRQGMATKLMEQVCLEADSKNMVLLLKVEPFGCEPPLSIDQLVKWYAKFRFSKIQEAPILLARTPGFAGELIQ